MTLNVALNMFLIPSYSYIGASIATDITRFFVILVEYIILSKIGFSLQDKVFFHGFLRIIASSLIMASFIWYFKSMNLLLLIVVSALLYFVTLYLMRGFNKNDLFIARRLIYGKNEK